MELYDLDNPGQFIDDSINTAPKEDYNERLLKKRDNLKAGKLNVLPFPFKRASYYYPGLERPTYVNVSAETKVGKSNVASYMFIFSQLWESYHNHKAKIKYLYIHAEESEDRIKDRIVSFLLFKFTKGIIRIGYRDLNSATIPLSDEVVDILQDDVFIDIRDYFFNSIEFADESYPTGIAKSIIKFAEKHGTILKGDSFTIENKLTGKKTQHRTTVGYVQNDPDEFLIVFFDNFNNVTPESGQTLLQAITVVSKNFKDMRNKLGLIIIALQQQNSDGDTNDAFKQQRVEPSVTRYADCKQTARDQNIGIGIFSPYMKFNSLPNGDPRKMMYKGYDIQKLGNYFRTINFLIDRDGESAKAFPIFFDGKVCDCQELPPPDNIEALKVFYDRVEQIKKEELEDKKIKDKYKHDHGIGTIFMAINSPAQIKNNYFKKLFARLLKFKYLCKHLVYNK